MPKLVIVVGPQGAGKTTYIKKNFPLEKWQHIDFEVFREMASNLYPNELDQFDISGYYKIMAFLTLGIGIHSYHDVEDRGNFVLERTAMTKMDQAENLALIDFAQSYNYDVEVVFCRPLDRKAWYESLDKSGKEMYHAMASKKGGKTDKRWRNPLESPHTMTRLEETWKKD